MKLLYDQLCFMILNVGLLRNNCWEIASNSNCDLKSQLGFLVEEGKINLGFLVVEEKSIPY